MTTTLQTEAKAGPLTGAPVDFLVVYVTDLACARAFYEETLGLRVAAENDASITYETGADTRPDSRVRVKVSREGASVRLSPAVAVSAAVTNTAP